MAAELVPFRWAMRHGRVARLRAEEASIVAAIAARSAAAWRASTRRQRGRPGLDTAYPPPDMVVPHTEIAKQVPVAWLVRIEVEAQRLLAEATRSTTGWSASTLPARPASTPAQPA